MDIGGWAALLGVGVALFAAVVTLLRDRSGLRKLESILPIVERLPSGAIERKALEHLRDDLAFGVAVRHYAPRMVWRSAFGWLLTVGGILFMGLGVVRFLSESFPHMSARGPIVYSIGTLMGMAGSLTLFVRVQRRTRWEHLERARWLMSDDRPS